ncbi:MAG: zf-TFIIB domain-containing protein [Dehalococcoidia bacterium]|jgi:Zn-finger nucleic acid-binding protein
MECPKCHQSLTPVTIGGIRIDRCPQCGGSWYDRDELRVLKDRESGGAYSWIHFDLWKDREKFRAREQQRYACPKDGQAMTTVQYGDLSIAVDVCGWCKGMWLDKEEYDELIHYLEEKVDSSSSGDYLKDIREELVEVLEVRESPITAMKDVGKVLYLLELRFAVEHPGLASLASALPKF